MARRRNQSKWGKAAYGLASGSADYFAYLLKQQAANRQMEHQAKLAEDRDARTLARQGELAKADDERAKHQKILDLLPRVASEGPDALTPDAFLSLAASSGVELFPGSYSPDYVGTGEPERERAALDGATHDLLQGLRPPMRRKLESTVGKSIADATTPEAIPGAAAIGMQALAADDRAGQGPNDPFGAVDQNDPLMRLLTMAPEVSEYANRALDKKDALLSAPGDRLAIDNPDGSQTTLRPTRAQEVAGITTKPNATTQGTLKGTTEGTAKKTELGIAGPALAKQAGAESYARKSGEIGATLANSEALIDHEVRQATAKLPLIHDETMRRKGAEDIAAARAAARTALPIITQLQTKWLAAEHEIRKMAAADAGRAALGAAEAAVQAGGEPLQGTVSPAIVGYLKLANYARPLLARASGQTGNPALMEQEWAKYVPSWSDALVPDNGYDMLGRLEALNVIGVDLATRSALGEQIDGRLVDSLLQPKVEALRQGLKERAAEYLQQIQGGAAPNTFIVTPSGIQLAPRPGGR